MYNERKDRIIEGICKIDQTPIIARVGDLSAEEIVDKLNENRTPPFCHWGSKPRTWGEAFDWDPAPKEMTLEQIRELTFS